MHILMEGYIKIQQIAEDLADHPMLKDISFDRIVNYAQELIKVVGAPKLYLDKTEHVNIDNYRGQLPCDFVRVIQVRGINGEEYVKTMNNFHTSPKHDDFNGTPTYKIQGDVIFSSRKHDDLEIAYRAVPIDEDGWPLLPDDETFKRALEAYIKLRRFTIYFDMGQIAAPVLENARKDYSFYVGQAQSHLILPTYDEQETITNVWKNYVTRTTSHRNGFLTEHNKEYLRRH